MHVPAKPPSSDQVRDLAFELRSRLAGEVRFDQGSRALYATDASNYRQVPIGVVVPRQVDDVVATVEVCRRFQVPLLTRGGGTSLAGQCCNAAVVLDFSKHLDGIVSIDVPARRAVVQPGVVLDRLRAAALPHQLTFAPDPSTHSHCTLGGMIGNNSCGVHSILGGRTAENVIALDILTADGLRMTVGPTSDEEHARIVAAGGRRGEIYAALRALRDRYADTIRSRYPRIPRRVSGFNLDELLPERGFNIARALVGTEGTCVVVLGATVRLVPWPKARALAVLGYSDVYHAADHLVEVLAHEPIGLEAIDDVLVANMHKLGMRTQDVALLPPGNGWLFVEFGGDTRADAEGRCRSLVNALRRGPQPPEALVLGEPELQERLWAVREAGLGATAHLPGQPLTWEGWEDAAVPPDQVGVYLREFRTLLERFGYGCSLYGHFGQGCIHTRIDFDLASAGGIADYRAFTRAAAELVLKHGGSLSGEHGDGQSRAELLPLMFGEELVEAFRRFKAIWDPERMLNPGKVVDAYRRDENLRLGTSYQPWIPETTFRYPEDGGNFARASLRCVGIGECRREGHGVMCPSYMVTKDEQHSTRGRAHLLHEMLRGEVVRDGWRSREVKDSLDLCLACKGCKKDCPAGVDLATYKAEFLSHYYERRLRPRSAYAMGLIRWWARLASLMPGAVNAVLHAPVIGAVAKWAGGIAAERTVPRFARETFRTWFLARPPGPAHGRPVLLWPDTFTDHFHPHIARDTVAVLEAAGFTVRIPRRALCCGRPLYDYGMLGAAQRLLHEILTELRDDIRAGVPLVGLEPSCLAVFRDELCALFPFDEDARRLSRQSFTIAEVLAKHAPGFKVDALPQHALIQTHCHQHALFGVESERGFYTQALAGHRFLDSGCCGMAGSFGFERDHYDVSRRCAERSLLPEVRVAAPGTLVIADGFSCREQIAQLSAAKPVHTAEVLWMALAHTVVGETAPTGQETP